MSDTPIIPKPRCKCPPKPQVTIRTSTLAIVSLITGILCWFLLPLIGAIIAVVTGHMAKSEIRQSNGLITGEGMATAGLVLGYIHLGLSLIGLCILGDHAGVRAWAYSDRLSSRPPWCSHSYFDLVDQPGRPVSIPGWSG